MRSALVIAAELSDRYITDRFLPDKAIDLVDEACSSMRVQLDSLPEDIDRLQRRVIALQVRHNAVLSCKFVGFCGPKKHTKSAG